MKYIECYNDAVTELRFLGHDEAKLDVGLIMEKVSGISRIDWFFKREEEMPREQEELFDSYVERLKDDEPVSYIIGTRDFMGFTFKVTPDTLIPRQDTENLCEEVINWAVNNKKKDLSILDLCTGSGCIAISIKKFLERKGISGICLGSDISEGALSVAEENAKLNEADVKFVKSDAFKDIEGSFDVIVSNPPYIPEKYKDELDRKVVDFEPYDALFSGWDGLDFYKIIAKEAKKHLNKEGMLFLEIGCDQGESVPEILKAEGYEDIMVKKDYNNLDRVVIAVYRHY